MRYTLFKEKFIPFFEAMNESLGGKYSTLFVPIWTGTKRERGKMCLLDWTILIE